MEITQIETPEQVEDLLVLAKDHPAVEYDCPFAYFSDYVRSMFKAGHHIRGWLAIVDGKTAGYVIAVRQKSLVNQISVFDIYVKSEYRGQHLMIHLLNKVREWMLEDNALRVVWTSKWAQKDWAAVLQKLGLPGISLSQYSTFVFENRR